MIFPSAAEASAGVRLPATPIPARSPIDDR